MSAEVRSPRIKVVGVVALCPATGALGFSDGNLPWGRPPLCDMHWFRGVSASTVLLMGRKTAQTMKGRLGAERPIVVMSRSYPNGCVADWTASKGVSAIVGGLEGAMQAAEGLLNGHPTMRRQLTVCGGAEIYRLALSGGFMDELHVSWVRRHEYSDEGWDGDVRLDLVQLFKDMDPTCPVYPLPRLRDGDPQVHLQILRRLK